MNTKQTKSLPTPVYDDICGEITVIFKTGKLLNEQELRTKYNNNFQLAVNDLLHNFSLFDLVEKEYQILDVQKIETKKYQHHP